MLALIYSLYWWITVARSVFMRGAFRYLGYRRTVTDLTHQWLWWEGYTLWGSPSTSVDYLTSTSLGSCFWGISIQQLGEQLCALFSPACPVHFNVPFSSSTSLFIPFFIFIYFFICEKELKTCWARADWCKVRNERGYVYGQEKNGKRFGYITTDGGKVF